MLDSLQPNARQFLSGTAWSGASCAELTGDASVRKYFRLSQSGRSAILMDASAIPHTLEHFIWLDCHLRHLGLSAPEIFAEDRARGFLILEDFGDDTFARLLEGDFDASALFTLATDVLIALHSQAQAIPAGLRTYDVERMLSDLGLYLEWCRPGASEQEKGEFRAAWRTVLPLAHEVPRSLLLRDYHSANLMLLPQREGVRRAGLLDFQDAYQGPITYDLMSLLEDARRDVPEPLRGAMVARYLAHFPQLDRDAFHASMTIVAALRHTRVLAIFERLSQFEKKDDYRRLHSPRVQALLRAALRHPVLSPVRIWLEQHDD